MSRALETRGWDVTWVRPASGRNEGVDVQWPSLVHPDLNIRGRRHLLPAYLAVRMRARGIRYLWLSGWTLRDLGEISSMIRTLHWFGIRVIYDTVDPVCEIWRAQDHLDDAGYLDCLARVRPIYEQCDLVLAVTPQLRDLLISQGARHAAVARWGTDASLFDPSRVTGNLKQQLGLPSDTFLVGWLGTMEPFKGLQEVILPLIEEVAKKCREIHFVIAGRGTLENELRTWAAKRPSLPLSILPAIAYPDAPRFTGSLDLYLVPTNPATDYARSICPVKCFDALAMGTRLVTTRTPATEFLSQHPDLVSLVDFDCAQFANAVTQAYQEHRRAPRRPEPVRTYSHQAVSHEIAELLEQIV